MDIATAAIVFGLFVFLPAVLVCGLFVWAALKDGQEDRACRRGSASVAARGSAASLHRFRSRAVAPTARSNASP